MESVGDPSVLSKKLGGGPHGLGDPLDRSLRNVEIEVLIPKKMREKARDEKCFDEVKAFNECCKESSLFMVVTCRKENSALKECLNRWYQNEEFKNSCKEEYLSERSEFRRTGIPQKHRDKIK
ncbi:COX assembly mitochondrial protein homolog [Periplaneta americana]|uniref:COX assembly mitochondrial protein homolog n=1 Tax=Periplaneta americana TaxID=6978 RepID=UPI0037E9564E